jgi:CheY-like chemotaxis protein
VTERPESSHEPSSAKEPIVFVVEDDASMRRALSNLFESVGLVVEHIWFGVRNAAKQASRCRQLPRRQPSGWR